MIWQIIYHPLLQQAIAASMSYGRYFCFIAYFKQPDSNHIFR